MDPLEESAQNRDAEHAADQDPDDASIVREGLAPVVATVHDVREKERRRGSSVPWAVSVQKGDEIPRGERAGAVLDALPGTVRQVMERTGLTEPYVRQTLSRMKTLGAVRQIGYSSEEAPDSTGRSRRAIVYARNY